MKSPAQPVHTASALQRALETERTYFELGAQVELLAGAELAWTPSFVRAPASAIVHRVDQHALAHKGPGWLIDVEDGLIDRGIGLSRIYLQDRDTRVESVLSDAGYVCREELVFVDNLPDPPTQLTFRPVCTEEDWARKLSFHEQVTESPDGHINSAADLVGLERHKCAHGMESFFGEVDGSIVGVVGAVWGQGVVRIKNLLVHHDHRRQSVATTLLSHIAVLGRARGIREQCLFALTGKVGERLYRSLGMRLVGSQTEWSKPLSEAPS
jgi:ribosomal protein S18 acetylase RimI-like enzyme